MNIKSHLSYDPGLQNWRALPKNGSSSGLVSVGSDIYRAAFDNGLSPDEELTALGDMSEWRGCGCGGGG